MEALYGWKSFKINFADENDQIISSIRKKINSDQTRIFNTKADKERRSQKKLEIEAEQAWLDEINRLKQLEIEERTKITNLLVCAKNLQFEIKTRHDIFIEKCEIKIDQLSDYELLDLRKREEHYHIEVRELIDKVSSFEKCVLPCGDAAADLREKVISMRNTCTDKFNSFLKEINSAISKRDVSEKKLENAAGLRINISKFKGYYSDVDIYRRLAIKRT